MAVAVIQRLWGEEVARQVAEFSEYTWHEDTDSDPFVTELNKPAAMPG